MTNIGLSHSEGLKKYSFFLVFFTLETMVFAILPLSTRLPMNLLLKFHAGLTGALLLVALLLRKSQRGKHFFGIMFVLFVAGMAVLLSTLFNASLLVFFRLTPATPPGIAIAKLSESLWRVIPILVLNAIIGADRRSLYLNRGKLEWGLAVGFGSFVGFASLAFLPLAKQVGMLSELLALSPWILIFVFSNGFMEELLYRGLFLRRYEPFLGKGLSNLLTALVFTLLHLQVTYVLDLIQFIAILFPLALAWGYLMQKTDSLWGSALFHAGADCVIVTSIFAGK